MIEGATAGAAERETDWKCGDLDGDWDRCGVDSDDEMSTVSGLWFPAESRGVATWLQRRWIEHGTRLGVRPWSDVVESRGHGFASADERA
jgi:hypothetical protein